MNVDDVIMGKMADDLEISRDNTIFVLIAGTTEVSLRQGITAAGSSPESTRITPTVDSEIIGEGRCLSMDEPPMTPEGIPTPAIVSRAILSLTGLRHMIVNGGFSVRPKTIFLETYLDPSRDPGIERSIADPEKVMDAGRRIGRMIDGNYRNIIIGESFPGGTTTAYIVLKAMGIDSGTSSTMPTDPDELKRNVAEESFRRRFVRSPLEAATEYGDNLMLFMVGMAEAVRRSSMILAGGTQMANVANLIRHVNGRTDPVLATTQWVFSHRSDLFRILSLEDRSIVSVMDFSRMKNAGLRFYNQGHVREGVGMGALYAYARIVGFSRAEIESSIDEFYSSFLNIG
ncbi:nicotinate-nucleotide--dimethylbenzimidazole phosphoribosyltransferase [Thermoplasma sp.]|uniref:nicotinate-nucleotide--dimethylbenzimidazole phosphoribosyltransferase n=1 Tax=Thermoplasma sp. TaxID=1973142 RepID=UPI00127005CA|nr:nicotinate-nucleotide--dimethylbenzimidazole phosphoribosyltransferase [Thermoplasma sp.]KAA8922344.1 MAG: nicotinate-nucleotide--dimethylbenzimidazole phosphoribosyltransferase [Thermoplasma sp.]